VPAALNAFDHPSADGINSYIVAGAVRGSGVKVALSGIGGDEIFGGYSGFRLLNLLHERKALASLFPKFIRTRTASVFTSATNNIQVAKLLEYLKTDLDIADNYHLTRKLLFDHQIKRLGFELLRVPSVVMELVEKGTSYSLISKLEIQNYLHDVLLRDTDQMSMSHALEVRAPFLDHRLIDYVLGLPNQMKVDAKVNKSLFVTALRDFIPDDLINRPKQGFSMPFDRWMRNELKAFCMDRLSFLKRTQLFSTSGIDLLWNQFLSQPKAVSWSRIWLLVSLSNWIEQNEISVMHE
jgi:asparagine synthase (glutamine-hydrolysing)